jgi:DMSO/TMAO reductase YedYZ molybdopterin-dependent catalytic subunit
VDLRPPLAGIAGAAVGLGVAELTAGVVPDGRSPVVATGELVIRNVPVGTERWAIETFGENDKVVLVVGTVVIVLLLGAVAAWLFRHRAVAAGIATFAVVVGAVASVRRVDGTVLDVIPPVVGGLAAMATIVSLLKLRDGQPVGPLRPDGLGRRTFLATSAAAVVLAPVAAAAGRKLQQRVDAAASRSRVVLPPAARPLPPIPDGTDFGIRGVAPFTTPLDDFYRIDTALLVPQVEAEGWTLRIHGRVDRELVLTYDDLLDRDLVEADVTLCCVSNEVGDTLIGNARWLGVPLAELLEEAGVRPGTDQVVGRSVDRFTAGFPLSLLRDGRDALVAVGMNGEPLPVRHGFPARLVVSGLYGYVSATKWLEEIELTRFADFDAYWVRLDWAPPGPIKLQSRIDVPKDVVTAGDVTVAGVAWAQNRGISAVEVRVDEGRWERAELAEALGADTWRQWRWTWDAEPGKHTLQVRATGGDGEVQTSQRAEPFPSGATGWHTVEITAV